MYPAFVRGHRPLALREYVDRVPIIAARSRRDDDEECPDLGARPFCRHVVVPLPTVGARGGRALWLRGGRRGCAITLTAREQRPGDTRVLGRSGNRGDLDRATRQQR
jgi:hypothetical protein